ncbi:hypothetical protein D8674_003830 [Pyrus ussuriensis x Pyrus communis]|uniref:Uncharacterized protein n=1 Tax=Pyrus ussuriensis x Pyrus communis TaxID=2448454 RepID=A0A5N5FI53_9ROSA|nr:hypothetical protein D8674_003830 [Pyrus ussuriensis x Pyrus communis]
MTRSPVAWPGVSLRYKETLYGLKSTFILSTYKRSRGLNMRRVKEWEEEDDEHGNGIESQQKKILRFHFNEYRGLGEAQRMLG